MADALSLYDVQSTFAAIDANVPRVLALGATSLIANFVFFGSAAVRGFRLRTYTMPLAGTLIFIPHDLHFLLEYEKWFFVYDHWFMQLFFVGLCITNVLEGVFLYQTLRFGRPVLLPQVSQRAYVAILLAALAATSVIWVGVKAMLADELWFFSFGFTIWFCVPFVIPMMLSRGNRAGNSRGMWSAFIVMALCWWFVVWPLDPVFRSAWWVGLGVVIVGWALAVIGVLERLPEATPASGTAPGEREVEATATA